MFNPEENMKRLGELTKDFILFSKTIDGTTLLDANKTKKAKLVPVHKEKDFAVLVAEVESGFVHQAHNHAEYEIICLLEGKVEIAFDDKINVLVPYIPLTIPPGVIHEVYYLENTRMLTITVPASEYFPEMENRADA